LSIRGCLPARAFYVSSSGVAAQPLAQAEPQQPAFNGRWFIIVRCWPAAAPGLARTLAVMHEQARDAPHGHEQEQLMNARAVVDKLEQPTALFPNVALAAAVVSVVFAGEYVFRHYLLFWMPTVGTLRVNDMLALAMAYSLLTIAFGSLTHANWRQEVRELGQALRSFTTQWTYTPWLLGLMLGLVVLPAVDQWLWAGLRFPMWVSSFRNAVVWFPQAASALEVLALIAVNGILVPIAEEYLWRGLIQACLLRVLPGAVAIGMTAILFSLKHVVADASWGRFLTLVVFGIICGIVAQRHTWRSSAALHLVVNTATTVVGLALGKE
jgi:membrane protease YdiL (CAAX protease family)